MGLELNCDERWSLAWSDPAHTQTCIYGSIKHTGSNSIIQLILQVHRLIRGDVSGPDKGAVVGDDVGDIRIGAVAKFHIAIAGLRVNDRGRGGRGSGRAGGSAIDEGGGVVATLEDGHRIGVGAHDGHAGIAGGARGH